MHILTIAMIGFLLLETTNVITLYFFPGSKRSNGVGVFDAWEKSKQDSEVHDLVKYLVNWVAGTKLIFIMLLIVILILGDEQILRFTAIALIVSIVSFFWRLFPLARKMDKEDHMTPSGYSIALGIIISAFIVIFAVAFVMSLL